MPPNLQLYKELLTKLDEIYDRAKKEREDCMNRMEIVLRKMTKDEKRKAKKIHLDS